MAWVRSFVFVATELHSDTIFLPNNNIKIESYPLSIKVSRKALVLLKQIGIHFNFLLIYSLALKASNTLRETSEVSIRIFQLQIKMSY